MFAASLKAQTLLNIKTGSYTSTPVEGDMWFDGKDTFVVSKNQTTKTYTAGFSDKEKKEMDIAWATFAKRNGINKKPAHIDTIKTLLKIVPSYTISKFYPLYMNETPQNRKSYIMQDSNGIYIIKGDTMALIKNLLEQLQHCGNASRGKDAAIDDLYENINRLHQTIDMGAQFLNHLPANYNFETNCYWKRYWSKLKKMGYTMSTRTKPASCK